MLNIKEKISLAPLTSFRIGGDSDFYVEVGSEDELKEALDFAKKNNMEFYIIGGGSNLLVSDEGFRGLVIRPKMNKLSVSGNEIEVEAGVPLIKLINFAAENGLSGMEKMAGIPGSVGGAVRGNAGAFGTEMSLVIKSATFLDYETLEIKTFENEQCEFEYRFSVFKKNKNFIVMRATILLEAGDPVEIKKRTMETIQARLQRGLSGDKSAGSYFINPKLEDEKLLKDFENESGVAPRKNSVPAGWVIERVGLRGKEIGGAKISEKHANYIINTGKASASDVVMLASFVKQQVRDQLGVQLQEEVSYLGF